MPLGENIQRVNIIVVQRSSGKVRKNHSITSFVLSDGVLKEKCEVSDFSSKIATGVRNLNKVFSLFLPMKKDG